MRKLIVLSCDAMVTEDLELLRTLPNFREYLAGGAEAESIRTVYPSLTYPVHTSILTGCYPGTHGVINNSPFTLPSGRPGPHPWNWFHDAVKVPDIHIAAKKAGLKTASVYWPVTGNHPGVDYLIDEYWPQFKGDTLHDAHKRAGASPEVLEIIDSHAGAILHGHKEINDSFVADCACDIIRRFTPDLITIHTASIDEFRHCGGVFHKSVKDGIYEADRWIGQLCEAAIEAGVFADTDFILVSDHGQIDIKRVMKLNVLLAEAGLITVEDGEIRDWKAVCNSGAAMNYVYLKDPGDRETYDRTLSLLRALCAEGVYGFERVYTRQEAEDEEHLTGSFAFALETDGYTSFNDGFTRPLLGRQCGEDYRVGFATHGHHPDKGPQPVFVAKGPGIPADTRIPRSPIVNEAPTFAKLLGVDLPTAQGVPLF